MPDQNTALLQNWLKTVVTSPGYLPQKLARANHAYQITEVDIVSDEGNASVYDRLNVYSSGYILRLLDCMSADFPVLQKFIGEEVFNSFVKAYLIYHPSSSFTLYDLGKAFPGFLSRTRPKTIPGEEDGNSAFLDLPIALAQLERARQEAMRAHGTETSDSRDDITMEDIMFQPIRVSVPGCFQLLQVAFPMKQFFEAVYRDEEYELPLPQKTFMAVSRKNYRVVMEELTEWQYLFLKQCAEPIGLHQAITNTAAATQIPQATLLADIYLWLPFLQSNGFVYLEY
jgi:hypothetical protein